MMMRKEKKMFKKEALDSALSILPAHPDYGMEELFEMVLDENPKIGEYPTLRRFNEVGNGTVAIYELDEKRGLIKFQLLSNADGKDMLTKVFKEPKFVKLKDLPNSHSSKFEEHLEYAYPEYPISHLALRQTNTLYSGFGDYNGDFATIKNIEGNLLFSFGNMYYSYIFHPDVEERFVLSESMRVLVDGERAAKYFEVTSTGVDEVKKKKTSSWGNRRFIESDEYIVSQIENTVYDFGDESLNYAFARWLKHNGISENDVLANLKLYAAYPELILLWDYGHEWATELFELGKDNIKPAIKLYNLDLETDPTSVEAILNLPKGYQKAYIEVRNLLDGGNDNYKKMNNDMFVCLKHVRAFLKSIDLDINTVENYLSEGYFTKLLLLSELGGLSMNLGIWSEEFFKKLSTDGKVKFLEAYMDNVGNAPKLNSSYSDYAEALTRNRQNITDEDRANWKTVDDFAKEVLPKNPFESLRKFNKERKLQDSSLKAYYSSYSIFD